MNRKFWALALVLALVPATAAADQLVTAFLSGDHAEVARQGSLASARGLEPALVSPDRTTALAAIAAAPASPDGWELLAILADLAGGADRPIAAAATRAAHIIAGNLSLQGVIEQEIPRDALAARLTAWQSLADRRDRWADIRVLAIAVSADLNAALGRDPARAAYDLEGLAQDPDGQVRRAAFELTRAPLSENDRSLLGAAARSDRDEAVALSAAQALCSGIAFGDSQRLAREALADDGIKRVRALVADHALPIRARIGAAHCIADGEWQSRAALERLGKDTPAPWKEAVKALAGGSGTAP